ncbi:MAG TPA: Imm10 family immunity protein [Clostridia bacterium]
MPTQLVSNFVFASIEDDIIMVGFADDEYNTEKHLLLQKSLEFDEQDKELGQDKVHITYIDELYSSYGGIIKLMLKNATAEIHLDKETAKKLRTEEQIEIKLPKSDYDRDKLIYHLKLMFKEYPNIFSIK